MTRDWRKEMRPGTGLAPEVGHWIAGFVDGEGCFVIQPTSNSVRGYACSFHIKLRADDKPTLLWLRDTLDVGAVYDVGRTSPTRHPQAFFRLGSKKDCLKIVDLFDEFPLRSKKARDFAVWRQAVIFWSTVGGGRTDWSEMEAYYHALKGGRVFQELAA